MPAKAAPPTDSESVARKAYELWAARGYPSGDDQTDWHHAEAELSGVRTLSRPRAAKAALAARKPEDSEGLLATEHPDHLRYP